MGYEHHLSGPRRAAELGALLRAALPPGTAGWGLRKNLARGPQGLKPTFRWESQVQKASLRSVSTNPASELMWSRITSPIEGTHSIGKGPNATG